jgi:hypothetical protein
MSIYMFGFKLSKLKRAEIAAFSSSGKLPKDACCIICDDVDKVVANVDDLSSIWTDATIKVEETNYALIKAQYGIPSDWSLIGVVNEKEHCKFVFRDQYGRFTTIVEMTIAERREKYTTFTKKPCKVFRKKEVAFWKSNFDLLSALDAIISIPLHEGKYYKATPEMQEIMSRFGAKGITRYTDVFFMYG